MTIDQKLFEMLFEQAKASSRLRANYDMRTSLDDTSQRMLNALFLALRFLSINMRILQNRYFAFVVDWTKCYLRKS